MQNSNRLSPYGKSARLGIQAGLLASIGSFCGEETAMKTHLKMLEKPLDSEAICSRNSYGEEISPRVMDVHNVPTVHINQGET
jgi:hypothetical protein